MGAQERQALKALAEAYKYNRDFSYLSFNAIASRSGLARNKVRRAVRALARKGFAEYMRGLCTEDGEFVGSGYSCTETGLAAARSAKEGEGA